MPRRQVADAHIGSQFPQRRQLPGRILAAGQPAPQQLGDFKIFRHMQSLAIYKSNQIYIISDIYYTRFRIQKQESNQKKIDFSQNRVARP